MNKTRYYYLILSLSFALFCSCVALVIYNVLITKATFDLVNIILGSLLIAILVALVIVTVRFFTISMRERSINNKANFFSFKRAIAFDNKEMFLTKVNVRYLTRKNMVYIVTFTPFSDHTLFELIQSPTLVEFYGLFVDFINDYFRKENKDLKRFDYEYCYDDRKFIFYLNTKKEFLDKMISDFEQKTYEIKQNNDFRIFVQPFFGVYEANVDKKNEVGLFEAMNNSNIARRYGENNYEMNMTFNPNMIFNNEVSGEITIESIMEGLKNNEFEVYYQPKFHIKNEKFIGSEALIRWNSSKFGFVSPNKFINLAENGGIIHDIDIYLLDKVCGNIEEWKKRGREVLPVSVNVSLQEFYVPTFVNDIQNILERHNVNPIYIEIEITEKSNSAYSFLIVSVLKKIEEMKIKILMDDFGTGFSNIVNLKKLPIDIVKLDKSLIDDIAFDLKSREIVHAVILSCHAMNIQLIAEGVDSKEQVKILKDLNCDVIQGFYYSQPLPKLEYERFLANNNFEKKGK